MAGEFEGTIRNVVLPRGFGFLRPDGEDKDIFFHCGALDSSLTWDETLTERRVKFGREQSPRGERATNVRPVH